MTNPVYKVPDWKRSIIRKALRVRNELTDKALRKRLNVGRTTIQRVRDSVRG